MVVKSDLHWPSVAYAEGQKGEFVAKSLVPEVGFEPTRGCPHRFLSSYQLVFQRLHTTTNVHSLAMHQPWIKRGRTSVSSVDISAFQANWGSKWGSDFRGVGVAVCGVGSLVGGVCWVVSAHEWWR